MIFRTSACSPHGHPEVSFVFAEHVPVPGLEKAVLWRAGQADRIRPLDGSYVAALNGGR